MWTGNHVLIVILVHVGLIGTTQTVVGGDYVDRQACDECGIGPTQTDMMYT